MRNKTRFHFCLENIPTENQENVERKENWKNVFKLSLNHSLKAELLTQKTLAKVLEK